MIIVKVMGIFFLLSLLSSSHFSVSLAQIGQAGMCLVSVSLAELFCGYRTERSSSWAGGGNGHFVMKSQQFINR